TDYLSSEANTRFADLIGSGDKMAVVRRTVEKIAASDTTVYISGESGTGKELIARAIHRHSKRANGPFIKVNCGALTETLLESELFGHERGAFTGAIKQKLGRFELADGGTLFLDEVGDIPPSMQVKLLRALQEQEFERVGGEAPIKVDVRVVSATNKDLDAEVASGRFRQDLYFRLHVLPVKLPPLRERREDIPLLVEHFLRKYTAEMNKPVAGVTPEALDQLAAYSWPGNIRELENEVQRLVIQCDNEGFITPELLAPSVRKVEGLLGRVAPKKGTLKDMMEEVERWLLVEALREHGGNKTKTAETLGITREGLHKKLAKYGM
ncbi:MAG: Response regulator of zinc sigma-54-dependent two-component system, partial [bacterium]|nr:Response regulator of zinc sigma-54-dependent two-component system [bacterium]